MIMCGIGLLATLPGAGDAGHPSDGWNARLAAALARRGPDVPGGRCHFSGVLDGPNCEEALAAQRRDDGDGGAGWEATLHASVLHVRGREAAAQPAPFPLPRSSRDKCEAVGGRSPECALCWNGECYACCTNTAPSDEERNGEGVGKMIELIASDEAAQEEESDTILVTRLIGEALAKSDDSGSAEHEAIADAVGRIHGEFAFILFVPAPSSTKRSDQISAGHVYYGRDRLGRRSLLVHRSSRSVALSSVAVESDAAEGAEWQEIPPGIVYRLDLCAGEEASVSIPRLVNEDVAGLVPVSSSSEQESDDRSLAESAEKCITEQSAIAAPTPKGRDDAARGLLSLLDRAVSRRVMHAPPPKSGSADDASVAVLFSGGIDSVILAALSHRHVPPTQPIDLINVSFYTDANYDSGTMPNSPDRLAAILSYSEMLLAFPERRWRFVAVDVPYREVLEHEKRVRGLISPLNSTMDFNIGTAFYFAGRGRGRVLSRGEVDKVLRKMGNDASMNGKNASSDQPLLRFAGRKTDGDQAISVGKKGCIESIENVTATSSAKILLSGVGADEQMAGYGRHRTTYQRGGYEALRAELKLEANRLWTRNLGRDDRCLSDHGKEARFPYLDEDVMAYLEALPLELKCDMTLPPGEGDKLILRQVARTIGVLECSTLVKRAIQFGSHIAKVSDKSRFGSCRKATGQSKIVADKQLGGATAG